MRFSRVLYIDHTKDNPVKHTRALRRTVCGGLAFLCAINLQSCGNDKMAALEKYISEVKTRHQTAIEPIPSLKTYPKYKYPRTLPRDPFAPAEVKAARPAPGMTPDEERPKQPLEAFPLDALRMVGTLEKESQIWAIILAPDETAYRIKQGQYMGQNYGKVVSITKDKVELVELVRVEGQWQERAAELTLVSGETK